MWQSEKLNNMFDKKKKSLKMSCCYWNIISESHIWLMYRHITAGLSLRLGRGGA